MEIQDLLMMILVLAVHFKRNCYRASPAVNDPGTAIQIINSHVRLLLFDKVQNKKVATKSFTVKLQCLLVITDLFEGCL
jgi:uncharacterized membrane protein